MTNDIIRQIITDQINRHVAGTDAHRTWLAKDIADRVCAEIKEAHHTVYHKYGELLFAVGRKFDGEDRHATALRYICEAENCACEGPAQEAIEAEEPGAQLWDDEEIAR